MHRGILTMGTLSLVHRAVSVTTATPQVTWISPAEGSSFSSNDLLNATWTATPKVVSPSFSLCAVSTSSAPDDPAPSQPSRLVNRGKSKSTGTSSKQSPASTSDDSDECGGYVWPTVSVDPSSGDYIASLAVPSMTSSSTFYLVMKSDSGDIFLSPQFDVGTQTIDALASAPPQSGGVASGNTANGPATPPQPNPGVATPVQSQPAAQPSVSSTGKLQPIGPVVPPNFNPPHSTAAGVPAPTSPPGVSPTTTVTPADAAASAASRSGHVIAAAIAVPLTLVAFAAVIAAVACFIVRRKQRQSSYAASTSSSSSMSAGDGLTRQPPLRSTSSGFSSASIISEKAATPAATLPALHQFQPIQTPPHMAYPHAYPFMQSLPHAHSAMANMAAQQYGLPMAMSGGPPMQYYAQYPMPQQQQQYPMFMHPSQMALAPPPAASTMYSPGAAVPVPPTAAQGATRPILSRTITPASVPSLASQASAAVPNTRPLTATPAPLNLPPRSLTPGGSAAPPPVPAKQLTPPAVSDSQVYHLTMQSVLNSYMDQQRDVEYRDSKPIPQLPFEPVDLDAVHSAPAGQGGK